MALPEQNLPPHLSEETIRAFAESQNLPQPQAVHDFQASAAFHSIYVLSFSESAARSIDPELSPASPGGVVDLMLRVSGNHLPRVKTENEVATMAWVRANTNIPIPKVIRFDATPNNPTGHEFTLMSRAPGVPLHEVYQQLDAVQTTAVIDQLLDIIQQLHSHSWTSGVSGLAFSADGQVVPGPVLEEDFWQQQEVAKYWPPSESLETLNIAGPYASFTAYVAAKIRTYQRLIGLHESLAGMRDLLPRLDAFVAEIERSKAALDDTRYVLAHKDLHMANVMYDPAAGRVTAVLDWEFSGVVPVQRWDPVRAFLWNVRHDGEQMADKERLRGIAEERGKARGYDVFGEAAYRSERQEKMQRLSDFVRAIVEVCPRGQRADRVPGWRKTVEGFLDDFGC